MNQPGLDQAQQKVVCAVTAAPSQWTDVLHTVRVQLCSVYIMKYSLEQRVFIYNNFVNHKSCRTVVTNFHQSFSDLPEPSNAAFLKIFEVGTLS